MTRKKRKTKAKRKSTDKRERQTKRAPQDDHEPLDGGVTIEPRILLSATWIDGTLGDDNLVGTAGDDCIRGFAGNDLLQGLAGDDVLRDDFGDDILDGGAGNDTADYSTTLGPVTVDITDSNPQNTGAAGTDTLIDIEGVKGSAFSDVFGFANPADGAIYTVDGNFGTDTIDLTNFASSDVTFGDGSLTIDMGGGQSFQIDYSSISTISFGDVDATVLTANANVSAFSGSGIYIDAGQAFSLDVSGPGTIDWSYDIGTDALSVSDTTGTNSTTVMTITDLNGSDLVIGSITSDSDFGFLTTNVGVGSFSISGSANGLVGTVTIGGDLGSLDIGDNLSGTLDIQGNLGVAMLGHNITGTLSVAGNVTSLQLGLNTTGYIWNGGVVTVGGDLDSLVVPVELRGTLDVQGNLGSLNAGEITASAMTTIGGDTGSLTVGTVRSDVSIAGDLDTAIIGSITGSKAVTAGAVLGTLLFDVGGVDHGGTFATPTWFQFASGTAVTNGNPIVDAGPDQNVADGDAVQLAAVASDPDLDPISYTWTQISGTVVTLSATNIANPTFTAPIAGGTEILVFQVAVSDGTSTTIDTVTISVGNSAVVVVDDALTTAAGTPVAIDVLANDTDPDGDAITVRVDSGPSNGILVFTPTGITTDTNLTIDPSNNVMPSWSPDGSKIVFKSDRTGGDEIFVMDADGSNVTQLTNNASDDRLPAWSPDGSKIVFESTRDGNREIYIMDADGANQTRLTNNAATDREANWSPDGSKILFRSDRDGNNEIYVMDADGSNQTRLTFDGGSDEAPEWSPDGSKIVFRTGRDGNFEIYVMDADGSNQTRLTFDASSEHAPTWSPDGTQIMFRSDRDGNLELYVMDADGSNQTRLTNSPSDETSASWSPDGTRVAYRYDNGGNFEIHVADLESDGNITYVPNTGFAGSDSFTYIANDGTVDSAVATVDITVNTSPAASAGSDQAVVESSVVTLDASGSSDPDGDALTYDWTQVTGPAVTLSDPTATQPTFTSPDVSSPTKLTFDVRVDDGTTSTTDTVEIIVNPVGLVANWTFDGSGQTVIDATGYGSDGTLGSNGGPETIDPTRTNDPQRGNVLSFDGDDYVDNIGQGPGGSTFTISAWAYDDGTGSGWDAIYSSGDAQTWLGVNLSTGKIALHVGGESSWIETNPGTWSTSTWHHVTGTWDGTTARIFIDGVEQPTTISGTLQDPTAADATIGVYSLDLNQEWWHGLMDDVRVYDITLDAVEIAKIAGTPTADAGLDQNVSETDLVMLDGTGSSDPEAQALTYSWAQTSGPPVVLSDPTAAQPTFTAPEGLVNTAVTFDLTVSDGANVSAVDSVTVNIAADDDGPTADASLNQSVGETTLVTLDGTGSTDPEGQPLGFTWVQTGGPAVTLSDPTAALPTFTAPDLLANTDLTFQVTVTDGTNNSIDTVTITVNANNDTPTANAGLDQAVPETTLVTLDGTGSSDPEGQGLTYTWIQTGGPAVALSDPNVAQPTFTSPDLLANTDLTFQVTASDGTNNSVDTVTIRVNADNDAPAANAGLDQSVAETTLVTLDGSGSTDPEGQGLTYSWAQTGGPVVTLSNPNAAQPDFTAPNVVANTDFIFELTASDGTNNSVDTVTVTITAGNQAPTVTMSPILTVNEGDAVALTANATDPESQPLSYRWSQVSGPVVALSDTTSTSPTLNIPTGLGASDLIFQVDVSDGVNTVTEQMQVKVVAPEPNETEQPDDLEPPMDETRRVEEPDPDNEDSREPAVITEPAPVPEPVTAPVAPEPVEPDPTPTILEASAPDPEPDAAEATTEPQESSQILEPIAELDPTRAPVEEFAAPEMRAAATRDLVEIEASIPLLDVEAATFNWTQLAGPAVPLSDQTAARPTFEAPALLAGDDLVFQVEVNRGGRVAVETVVIHVSPTGTVTRGDIGPIEWHDELPEVEKVTETEVESEPKGGITKVIAGLFAFLFGTDRKKPGV